MTTAIGQAFRLIPLFRVCWECRQQATRVCARGKAMLPLVGELETGAVGGQLAHFARSESGESLYRLSAAHGSLVSVLQRVLSSRAVQENGHLSLWSCTTWIVYLMSVWIKQGTFMWPTVRTIVRRSSTAGKFLVRLGELHGGAKPALGSAWADGGLARRHMWRVSGTAIGQHLKPS
jgi:hypothetical protein